MSSKIDRVVAALAESRRMASRPSAVVRKDRALVLLFKRRLLEAAKRDDEKK